MGWELSAVTMEEVLGLVPGFVDILVLAGGRTSYGTAATWRSGDVQKALRWALFFEEVFRNLRDTGQYEDSAREFDAALVELTSSPDFPKGLADMRSGTLAMARVLVLKHFLKAKTMSVENLRALLEAVVEMDVDGIGGCGGHHAFQEGLSTLQNGGKKNSFGDAGSMSCALAIPKKSQMIDKLLLWKQWRGQCLSYLLDERTIRIVSGSSFIFSAPKEQWMKVFEPLKGSVDSCQSGLTEVMELCLLGLVSRRWDPLIGSFMSHTFNSLPISKQYTDLHQLLPGISQDEYQDRLLSSKEKDILEYAWQSIESKPHLLWLLPPVLTAAAIPPWSTLFKIYLAEIDKQFDEASSTNRKCNCRRDGIEQHHNCEIAERIQCLYTLHVEQPHLTLR